MSIISSLGRTEQLCSVLFTAGSLFLLSTELWLNGLEQIILALAKKLEKKNS